MRPTRRLVRPAAARLLGLALVASLLASPLGACASSSAPAIADPCTAGAHCEPDPVLALESYRDLLVAGRPREAFAWLHPEATEGLDADGFAHLFERHADALIAQAEDLVRQARATPPRLIARVRTERGEVLVVRTPEGWRLEHPVPARTP